jgi:hypothetical protein
MIKINTLDKQNPEALNRQAMRLAKRDILTDNDYVSKEDITKNFNTKYNTVLRIVK